MDKFCYRSAGNMQELCRAEPKEKKLLFDLKKANSLNGKCPQPHQSMNMKWPMDFCHLKINTVSILHFVDVEILKLF